MEIVQNVEKDNSIIISEYIFEICIQYEHDELEVKNSTVL